MQTIPDSYYRSNQIYFNKDMVTENPILKLDSLGLQKYILIDPVDGNVNYSIHDKNNTNLLRKGILSPGESIVIPPEVYYTVDSSEGTTFFMDYYQEKSPELLSLEEEFRKKFPDKSPHYEVMYLASILDENAHKTALDIGSGLGRNSLYLASQGLSVTSIDKNSQGLLQTQILAQKHNLDLTVREIDLNQDILDEDFDVIITTVALQFLQPDAADRVLEYMQSYAKIGGYNLIIVPIASEDIPSRIDFPNLKTYEEYITIYKDWDIVLSNNHIGRFHKKDKNGHFIISRFATILAQKR